MSASPDELRGPKLSAEDQAALDRLVDNGFQASAHNADDAARDQAMLQLLRHLDHYPIEDSDESLIDATLARIDLAEREQKEKMRLERAPIRSIRWSDLGGIAAVILLTAGVAWPAFTRMRATSLKASCANNMRAMGGGLSAYANDNHNHLPMTAGLNGLLATNPSRAPDWNTYEHGGNLVALANCGYCPMGSVQCPACSSGMPHKHFAFRMPASDRSFRLTIVARGALVADSNPILEMHRTGRVAPPSMASANHNETGQNVLFGDGALLWLSRPEVNGDNIYLPRGVTQGDLLPNLVQLPSGDDAFLAH